jgi:hypothetical protein
MRKMTLLALAIYLSCVHYTKYMPDPEKDIEQWVDNFTKQRSFAFCNALRTQGVYTESKGICIIDRIEHNQGSWYAGEQKVDFEYFGMGDIQYSRTPEKKWELSTRGEESNILTQITRVLEFDKFEYVGLEDGYLYNFKANIPFIAPGRWKEIIGRLRISTKHYLPVEIWTGLPDSSVYWKIELSGYNKEKAMKPPLVQWQRYVLKTGTENIATLKRRMDLYDLEYRLTKTKNDIILFVPEQYNIEDIMEILVNRHLIVYRAVSDKQAAQRVVYLNDQKTKPVYLGDSLFDENNIKKAKIKFDGSSTAYIELSLRTKIIAPERIAFELDSMIVGHVGLDTGKKIGKINMYVEMSYYEMQLLIGGLLEHLPQIEVREISE